MQILDKSTVDGADISSQLQVYSYTSASTIIVVLQVTLDNINGVSYNLNLYVDDAIVVPDRAIDVPVGSTKAIMQSRSVVVPAGSTLKLSLTGDLADTNVDILICMIDHSPLNSADAITLISPGVQEAVVSSLETVEVRPERLILGPCKKQVVKSRP